MRLFILNRNVGFTINSISERSKVPKAIVRKEISILLNSDFISSKRVFEEYKVKGKIKKRQISGYILNEKCEYLYGIEVLLIDSEFYKKNELIKLLRKAGKIKLLLISGIFLRLPKTRVDILLVGDNINKKTLERNVSKLESEIGKELTYAVFETKDFIYRLSMYDKLLREVLDNEYECIVENPEFSTYLIKKS